MIKALIYNSDIKAIQKKAASGSISVDEAALLKQAKWSESQLQTACRKIFLSKYAGRAKFIQIDNGGKMGIGQRLKKAREGTEKGALDVVMKGWGKRIAFMECKRIGAPSEIEPTEDQKEMYEFSLTCGFPAYFCNNTVYFEKVICEEFAKSGC